MTAADTATLAITAASVAVTPAASKAIDQRSNNFICSAHHISPDLLNILNDIHPSTNIILDRQKIMVIFYSPEPRKLFCFFCVAERFKSDHVHTPRVLYPQRQLRRFEQAFLCRKFLGKIFPDIFRESFSDKLNCQNKVI